jgi:glyoxylase-like metal-dependent hydrolase (beta-lactamase superfamily II)
MTTAITLKDITIHPVVEQQGAFFDVMEFFPMLTKEVLEENRSWLKPTFIDPVTGRLVLCVQSFVIKSSQLNIMVDSCVGNHKPRPARPFWNMMNSDRFEKNLGAIGLTVNDIDYVMCTHLHVDHVGWNTRLDNGRWVPLPFERSHISNAPVDSYFVKFPWRLLARARIASLIPFLARRFLRPSACQELMLLHSWDA